MGNDRGNYRRTILELVLVTAIFAVVSVFLLKIYLTADRLQGDAVAISTAAVRAQSVAETVKALGVEKAAQQFGMESEEGYYILRFDRSWEPVGENEKYQLILALKSEENGLVRAMVYAGGAGLEDAVRSGKAEEEELLCRLDVAVYRGGEP